MTPIIPRTKTLVTLLILLVMPLLATSQTCSTGQLDERVSAFVKMLGPDKPLDQLNVEKIKKDGPQVFKKLSPDSVKRITIIKDNIKVNVVNASRKSGLPVIVNFHPGGFVIPLTPWMEYEAMRLSKKFNAVVFDVDYRVAPEHKFPVARDDGYNAYLWVVEHASEYGGDPSKIVIHGSSAGATLAAQVMHKAKKEGKLDPIKLVIMNCPATDNPMISYYASYEENAKGYMLTKDFVLLCNQSYLDKSEWYRNNAEMWPIYEKDFSAMPPSLVITTEFDVFRDEGIAYAKKLEKAGNDVAIKCFPHQIHCFAGLPEKAGELQRLYELMGESIAKALKN